MGPEHDCLRCEHRTQTFEPNDHLHCDIKLINDSRTVQVNSVRACFLSSRHSSQGMFLGFRDNVAELTVCDRRRVVSATVQGATSDVPLAVMVMTEVSVVEPSVGDSVSLAFRDGSESFKGMVIYPGKDYVANAGYGVRRMQNEDGQSGKLL